ncbi:DNA-binding NarL/FixJ family response regulator [Azospirillum sp. OGB3]|uniref:response regulator transcription factor n=1 Tax=Azospirillum sp. OGB3 TaxID=2587012 RepID=UPI001605FB06|nr:response regulator transcription factor [Azospirillum sp. OGB3]MBB3264553.1 DNA-binding NarL/FixJ family response regulator [Azospirillum sp. OGB3]
MIGLDALAGIRREFMPRAPSGARGGARSPHPDGRTGGRAPIAVLLIDDRALFGESLAAAINAFAPDVAVSHRRSAAALADLPAALRGTDVVLVSIGRADPAKGGVGQLLDALAVGGSHPPVAILADRPGAAVDAAAARLGLRGVLSGRMPLAEVIAALRLIHGGGTVSPDPG